MPADSRHRADQRPPTGVTAPIATSPCRSTSGFTSASSTTASSAREAPVNKRLPHIAGGQQRQRRPIHVQPGHTRPADPLGQRPLGVRLVGDRQHGQRHPAQLRHHNHNTSSGTTQHQVGPSRRGIIASNHPIHAAPHSALPHTALRHRARGATGTGSSTDTASSTYCGAPGIATGRPGAPPRRRRSGSDHRSVSMRPAMRPEPGMDTGQVTRTAAPRPR